MLGADDPGIFTGGHSAVITVFANLLAQPSGVGKDFELSDLGDNQLGPWVADQFDASGSPFSLLQRKYEAVINVEDGDEPKTVDTSAPIEPQSMLPVSIGGTATILTTFLYSYDQDDSGAYRSADEVLYRVDAAPEHGTLLLRGAEADSFTQADIDNGLVQYRENGDIATNDRFNFTVYDPAGNHTAVENFNIAILDTTELVVVTNGLLPVAVDDEAALFGRLGTVALDHQPGDLTYQLLSAPEHGMLTLNGALVTTFTQADIDYNHLGYRQNGDAADSDSFVFVVYDAAGHQTGPQAFHIGIVGASASPDLVLH